MNPEIAQYEALFKDGLRRCMAEDEPAEIHRWLSDTLARLGGGDENAVLSWQASFDFTDALMAELERQAHLPASERKVLDFPWESWNNVIEPLEPGMLVAITAPDGQGKTILAECLAEHWARQRHAVVFVHYELNRRLMMLRRLSRHTHITYRELKSGNLTADQKRTVAEVRPRLSKWDGCVSYVHTADWTMERTIAELRRLRAESLCDVVVLDYLEKASVSTRQLKMFGTNGYQREADNVEQVKNFAEIAELPVVMLTQMSKAGKQADAKTMDRTDIRGAGEKSDKANVVILLHRDRVDGGGYSNTVKVQVDKNTVGTTGAFEQFMEPEYFRLGDFAK